MLPFVDAMITDNYSCREDYHEASERNLARWGSSQQPSKYVLDIHFVIDLEIDWLNPLPHDPSMRMEPFKIF